MNLAPLYVGMQTETIGTLYHNGFDGRWSLTNTIMRMGILGRIVELRRRQVLVRRFGQVWGQRLLDHRMPPDVALELAEGGELAHPASGLLVAHDDQGVDAALSSFFIWSPWAQMRGLRFRVREKVLGVEIGGLGFQLANPTDYFTLSEVFREELYRFRATGPFAFMDIGANVGMASLYFAKNHEGPVIAYELVPETAKSAKLNVALNPDLAPRIQLVHSGLGKQAAKMTMRFDPQSTACNSVYNQSGDQQTEVTLLDAAAELVQISSTYPDRKLCVKLDAEGAEYDILDRWTEAKCMELIDLLFLEWHVVSGRTVDQLRANLRLAGFQWFERAHATEPVGFITAWR